MDIYNPMCTGNRPVAHTPSLWMMRNVLAYFLDTPDFVANERLRRSLSSAVSPLNQVLRPYEAFDSA